MTRTATGIISGEDSATSVGERTKIPAKTMHTTSIPIGNKIRFIQKPLLIIRCAANSYIAFTTFNFILRYVLRYLPMVHLFKLIQSSLMLKS